MPPLPAPDRCIWCCRKPPEVDFDESHVLPECAGNRQQVLPKGIVCRGCNNHFGTGVEPALLSDPLFHIRAVLLQLVDSDDMKTFRDRVFDDAHPPVGALTHAMDVKADFKDGGCEIKLDISYAIQGVLSRTYSVGDLALISRAVHKIAFESLAWSLFVGGVPNPVDVFSNAFDPVRTWGRRGSPMKPIRPVLRIAASEALPNFGYEIRASGSEMALQLNLFGDYYLVALTGKASDVVDILRGPAPRGVNDIWVLSDTLSKLK